MNPGRKSACLAQNKRSVLSSSPLPGGCWCPLLAAARRWLPPWASRCCTLLAAVSGGACEAVRLCRSPGKEKSSRLARHNNTNQLRCCVLPPPKEGHAPLTVAMQLLFHALYCWCLYMPRGRLGPSFHLSDMLLASVDVDVQRHVSIPAEHQLLRPRRTSVRPRPSRSHLPPRRKTRRGMFFTFQLCFPVVLVKGISSA